MYKYQLLIIKIKCFIMRITKHITFYYLEDRIIYINNIIDETNKYEYTTDIFIHTNNINLEKTTFNNYTNGCITIIYHDLSNINPFYLSWKCRELLQKQKNDYDIFMYIEDDILVPYKAIKYWLKYNEPLIEMNYNLGFVRIEVKNNIEYITDLPRVILNTFININKNTYCVNNINSYCAFWIYNKTEFNKFVNSTYYNLNNLDITIGIREISAFGLHTKIGWYKNTLIPIINNTLIEDCKIYHMPNNYVNNSDSHFATIEFSNAVNLRKSNAVNLRKIKKLI